MDLEKENLVSIKEEWIDDHVTEETPEAEPTGPVLRRWKEEPIDHEIDHNGWSPESSPTLSMKSEPYFQSRIENPNPHSPASVPSEIQTTQPIIIEPMNQPADDPLDQKEPCRGFNKSAVDEYSCDICDYTSIHVGNLKRHLKQHNPKKIRPSAASREKVYACEFCGYKCAEFTRLKRHLMTHTGEKPLACDACNFRTSHSNDLQRHMMVHTGEKPYACDLCDYKSSDVRNLKRHKRTHTGEKPYACDSCGYRSRTSHHMNRHKLMKHKSNP